jgi:hypothetical protein
VQNATAFQDCRLSLEKFFLILGLVFLIFLNCYNIYVIPNFFLKIKKFGFSLISSLGIKSDNLVLFFDFVSLIFFVIFCQLIINLNAFAVMSPAFVPSSLMVTQFIGLTKFRTTRFASDFGLNSLN